MDMPGGISFVSASPSFFGGNITASVNNGSLSIERVDDMCRRIMTPYFRLGQNNNYPPIDASSGGLNFFPVTNYLYNFTEGPANVDVRDDHAALIRELGAAGIVLLKNVNNTLPLKTPANVGVFGNDAPDISVGLYLDGDPDLLNIGYDQGVLPVGGGSGTGRMTYVVAPLDAIKTKVFSYNSKALVQYVTNNTEIIHNKIFGAMINPTPPEVCLVSPPTLRSIETNANLYTYRFTAGHVLTSAKVDWNGSAVVETVAASCPNTVVITNSGGLNVLPFANNVSHLSQALFSVRANRQIAQCYCHSRSALPGSRGRQLDRRHSMGCRQPQREVALHHRTPGVRLLLRANHQLLRAPQDDRPQRMAVRL